MKINYHKLLDNHYKDSGIGHTIYLENDDIILYEWKLNSGNIYPAIIFKRYDKIICSVTGTNMIGNKKGLWIRQLFELNEGSGSWDDVWKKISNKPFTVHELMIRKKDICDKLMVELL